MEKPTNTKWKKLLCNLDIGASICFMTVLIAITFMGTLARYLLHAPFTWMEEVQVICIDWIIFLTGGYVFRRGAHIAVEIVVDSMPPALQRAVQWLIRIVVTAILAFLLIQCVGYVQLFVNNGRVSPVLRIPYWIIYLVAPLGCADMLISFLSHEVKEARALRCQRKEEDE